MQTQISEKLGQSGSVFQAEQGYNPQVSTFDLSKKSSLTFSEGMIIPLDVIRCIPNDTHRLSYRWLLDVMPMVVPPQTNYKFITAAYWCSLNDLWKGAETFVTKGRSANINMSIPVAKYWENYTDDRTSLNLDSSGASNYSVDVPHGLPAYLGLTPTSMSIITESNDAHSAGYLPFASAIGADGSENTDQITETGFKHIDSDGVNASIPFMYQKVCRMGLPTNLLQDNKIWFPNDISNDDWRLAPDGSNLSANGHFVPIGTPLPDDDDAIANFIPHVGSDTDDDPLENCVNIWQMRYAQYPDDLATTSKPWLVRGSETTVDLDVTDSVVGLYSAIDIDATAERYAVADGKCSVGGWSTLSSEDKEWYRSITGLPMSYTSHGDLNTQHGSAFTSSGTNGIESMRHAHAGGNNYASYRSTANNSALTTTNTASGVTAVDISSLGNIRHGISFSNTYVTLQPSAITDNIGVNFTGARVSMTANTLRSLIAFSVKDEIDALTNGNYNATIRAHYGTTPKHHDFEPRYIGGSVEYLNFGSVMQTSASTDSQPMGSVAGTGNNSAGVDFGTFHCDDFGYIMVVGYVVPEVTYSTGIDRMWTDVEQEDLWFPEYSALGFQPVLNKEIFVSGTQSTDNGLFGYQTRGIEYKQRRNDVRGLFALSPDKDAYFSAYNQARLFSDTPKLSNEFTTCSPKNLRRDYLAFPDLPSYRLQLACDVKSTRTLPYKSVPARFGM